MTDEEGDLSTPGTTFSLHGTEAQIEGAQRIRLTINEEFDRVAASFLSLAAKQAREKCSETEAVIAILEDRRLEVMSIQRAGYSIKLWQESADQVRQMVFHDAHNQAIKSAREAL